MAAELERNAGRFQIAPLRSSDCRTSDSVTVAPRLASSCAAATPLRAAPATTTFLPVDGKGSALHRSFNVVSANSANTIARIRKRQITFDSLQPLNSK